MYTKHDRLPRKGSSFKGTPRKYRAGVELELASFIWTWPAPGPTLFPWEPRCEASFVRRHVDVAAARRQNPGDVVCFQTPPTLEGRPCERPERLNGQGKEKRGAQPPGTRGRSQLGPNRRFMTKCHDVRQPATYLYAYRKLCLWVSRCFKE